MGTQLSSIITSEEISITDISSKRLVVDAYNMLYQFLSTIRQREGSLLMDTKGNVTSHLSGLFFRIVKLMDYGVKLAFVFDGKAPDLKTEERERRAEIKRDVQRKYELAVEEGDIELMKKYASRTAVLSTEMIEEAQEMITSFGLPVIQAPSEGEAQAAYMVKKGEFYALVSQDTDGLLFGSPKIIKNLSITKKRKISGSAAYHTVNPELVDLSENLNKLCIDREQLIVIAMMCGTDFNVGGIKGIGPKKGLGLVKKHGKNFDTLFTEVNWNDTFDLSWSTVFDVFINMPITDDYSLKWNNINEKKILKMLVEKHDFSKERIEKPLSNLIKSQNQKGLGEFF